MKKVLIIGDSHTARLQNNLNVTFSEKCVWEHEKKIKSNCIDNHLNVLYEKEITIYFSYHKGKSAYKGYAYDNDKYPCIHQLISDEFIVLPWFGYIDVKQFLPMKDKKSPEIVAKKYVEQLIKNTNKQEVKIVGYDKYGRWLGQIYLDGKSISDSLIENNLAGHYYGGKKK